MRTKMNYAPGYGASPTREREFPAMDNFTALGILKACEEIRAEFRRAAAFAAERYSGHDFWASDLDGKSADIKLNRFIAALDELIDDFADQRKIEEAGEIAP